MYFDGLILSDVCAARDKLCMYVQIVLTISSRRNSRTCYLKKKLLETGIMVHLSLSDFAAW